jgi:hypothetical protein
MRASYAVLVTIAVILASTPGVAAGSFDKAYFAATPPGAWATYESSWEMDGGMAGTNSSTYIRAPDHEGRVRVEIVTRTLSGPGEGMTTRQLFVMEPGFDLATNFMNRMSHLEASVSQTGESPPSPMQDDIIAILRETGGDLTNSVTLEETRTIDTRECDCYAYSYSTGGANVIRLEGEICLDETVPFGVVFQKGRSTGQDGAPISTHEHKLVDSGIGRSATDALLAVVLTPSPAAPEIEPGTGDVAAAAQVDKVPTVMPTPPGEESPAPLASVSLLEAYQNGEVRLIVEVLEGSGGRRLVIDVENYSNEPLDLVVPAGPLSIPAESPIGTLSLSIDEEHRFSLLPGYSSPSFSAEQTGDRGATGGSFLLVVKDGVPTYLGEVVIGSLE